jgi:hypothetical protein
MRDMDDQALVGLIVLIVVGVVAAVGITVGVMYANDYGLEATVKDKECLPTASSVEVETKLFGIDHRVKDVPQDACGILQPGNFVRYHIRSQHTIIYEKEGGDCIYDSVKGFCGRASFLGV